MWTLDELTARVALALSVDYDGQPSGRVRDVPDGRVVRYYTTLGLVDRPLGYDGRTALYGRRHLAQIVAIKRLQARGRSLSEIQGLLLNLAEPALERTAALPPEDLVEKARSADRESVHPAPAAAAPVPGDREPFWKRAPAGADAPRPEAAAAPIPATRRAAAPPPPPGTLTGFALSPDAVLLAAFVRDLDETDAEAIRAAAAPLLNVLEKRGLLRKHRTETHDP